VRGGVSLGLAAAESILAGCDMLLVEKPESWTAMQRGIEDAIASGALPPERLEQSSARLQAVRSGLTRSQGPFSQSAWDRLAKRFAEFSSAA